MRRRAIVVEGVALDNPQAHGGDRFWYNKVLLYEGEWQLNCMTRRWIWLALIVLSAACGSSGSISDSPEQIAQGRQIYAQHCAECHGANGEGQRPEAPLERDETGRYPAPPHDGTGHTWHHDDDLLFQIVRDGGTGDPANFYDMPAFGDKLSEADIYAVLAFIKSLWTDELRAYQRQVTEQVRSDE